MNPLLGHSYIAPSLIRLFYLFVFIFLTREGGNGEGRVGWLGSATETSHFYPFLAPSSLGWAGLGWALLGSAGLRWARLDRAGQSEVDFDSCT